MSEPNLNRQWTFFSDRPVGLQGDLLWEGETIREQIANMARRVVAPLRPSPSDYSSSMSDSITFAIYGRWGMGKSSALNMLREEAQAFAQDIGQQQRLHFCFYATPAYEALPYDVRTTLALRILAALAGSPQQAVEEFLSDALSASQNPEVILPSGPPDSRVSWTLRSLENVAGTLARLVDYDRIVADYLSGQSSQDKLSHVLVVLIDDLDRCQKSFVWQVLDAIQQLSNVPNLFFAMAVDEERLRETVEERFQRVDAAVLPDFALEKYVQHAVWVPDMDETRVSRFITQLMQRYGSDDPVAKDLADNVQFLQHGLRVRTPRSIKRCLNTIRLDLARSLRSAATSDEKRRAIKDRILEYVWPDFHRSYVRVAASQAVSGRYRRALTALEQACADFMMGGAQDEERMRFDLGRIAERFRMEWQDMPLDLVRYLGTPPFRFVETPDTKFNTFYDMLNGLPTIVRDDEDDIAEPETEDHFMRLYINTEAAEKAGDRVTCLRTAEQLYQFTLSNRQLLGRQHCPLVGNVAVTAEQMKANDLALRLYQRAVELDPEHTNNLQNFVDFILNVQLTDYYPLAEQCLAKLRDEAHMQQRAERTLALEMRLKALRGEHNQLGGDRLRQMVAEFSQTPQDRNRYMSLMVLLDQIEDLVTMRQVTRIYYDHAESNSARYLAIRGLADMLASSRDQQAGYEAMEMYQYLLNTDRLGDTELVRERHATLHNYANLLYRFDYDDEAGRFWYNAYQLQPGDLSIRRAYSLYLMRAERPDLAAIAAEGLPLPVSEPVLQPKQKEMPAHFLDESFDRWWTK